MSKKLKSLLLAACAFVAIVGVNTARASAIADPPHGVELYVTNGTCKVFFSHGNVFGGAYAKYREGAGSLCGSSTYVRVTAWDGTRLVNGGSCGPAFGTGGCANSPGWWQSIVPPAANIVGSYLQLCNAGNSCVGHNYSGI
jgi:hypothetical protein